MYMVSKAMGREHCLVDVLIHTTPACVFNLFSKKCGSENQKSSARGTQELQCLPSIYPGQSWRPEPQ